MRRSSVFHCDVKAIFYRVTLERGIFFLCEETSHLLRLASQRPSLWTMYLLEATTSNCQSSIFSRCYFEFWLYHDMNNLETSPKIVLRVLWILTNFFNVLTLNFTLKRYSKSLLIAGERLELTQNLPLRYLCRYNVVLVVLFGQVEFMSFVCWL